MNYGSCLQISKFDKSAGWNKCVQVGKFLRFDKVCYTIIRDTKIFKKSYLMMNIKDWTYIWVIELGYQKLILISKTKWHQIMKWSFLPSYSKVQLSNKDNFKE